MKLSEKILDILNIDLNLDYAETGNEGVSFHSAIQL